MGEVIELSVVGVTVVFFFLTALVLSMQGLGLFFRVFEERFPGAPSPVKPPRRSGVGETARIAALVGAIEARRRRDGD